MDEAFSLTGDEDLPVEKKAAKKVVASTKPAYTYCESRPCIIIKEDKLSALCINRDSIHIFKDIVK